MSSSSSHLTVDFTFAFDNPKFSNRTLRLEIRSEWEPGPKRLYHYCNVSEDVSGLQNWYSTAKQVKTMHVSTAVLAAKSPFFYKLFSNGMSESNEKHVTIPIHQSEEVAFMDMLKFIYTNTLSSTIPSALLDVLIIADKYEVASCIEHCYQLLRKLPMTFESALLYLDLPSTSLMPDVVKPLTDAARHFLVASFNEMNKFEDEMYALPLVGIETILLSDDLQVDSEDFIYDFVMLWAEEHYPEIDERRQILTMRLLRLIRFPFMSCFKLKEVLNRYDIYSNVASELVFQALSFKIPHEQLPVAPIERAYKHRPVKVVRLDSPSEVCKVYLDLKHEECARLLLDEYIYSQSFDLMGQDFYLMVSRDIDEDGYSMGFYLRMDRLQSGSMHIMYEFSYRMKPTEKFVSKFKHDYHITNDEQTSTRGHYNLFNVPWSTLIAEDSPFFINGILHLKAVIRIMKE